MESNKAQYPETETIRPDQATDGHYLADRRPLQRAVGVPVPPSQTAQQDHNCPDGKTQGRGSRYGHYRGIFFLEHKIDDSLSHGRASSRPYSVIKDT